MADRLELVGQRYGRLLVLREGPRVSADAGRPNGRRTLVCLCDCGRILAVRLSNLRSGHARSCGCARIAALVARNKAGSRRDMALSR